MFRSYFRTAWRNLAKNKVYSFINITGLAIGLASALLISLWVKDEISYDRFHARGPQLYRVMANLHWGDVNTMPYVPAMLYKAMKKDIPEVEYAATVMDDKILLSVGDNHFKENGYYVTDDFLKMFSFPLLKGNIRSALSSPSGMVISQRLAAKYFGAENPIGKLIRIDDKDVFQVTGVIKNIPNNSSLQFDWLIPLEYHIKNNPWIERWGSYSSNIYVALRTDANLAKINGTLLNFLARSRNEECKDELFLQPYTEMYLHGNFKAGKPDGGRIQYVELFSLIAIIVLFIACINFMNLTTARSIKRAKEIGIRKVIGANRKAITWQFLGEAFFLTLVAAVFTLIIVQGILPYFNETTGKSIRMDFADPGFLLLIFSIAVITAFVAGSYPALFLSSFQPIKALKSAVIRSDSANILRKGLVVFQFSLSIILIVGAIIVYKQVEFIRNKNIGFDKETLVSMPVEGDTYTHLASFQEELNHSPGIKNSAVTGDNPIEINGTSGDLKWPGKPETQSTSVSATWVGYNYIQTMELVMVAGRDFSPVRADSNNYIINESAARLMNLKDPVGKEMEFWNGRGQIIGVVKDFHLHSLHEPITPLVISLQPKNASLLMVRTEKGKTAQAIASLKKIYDKYNSAYPFEYHFMDELYEQRYKSEMIIGKLVNAFSVMAIFISCLGLFGLATFMAEQRTKEIGIRKVMGASVFSITSLLSGDLLKLVLASIVIASPVAWILVNNWLMAFAYRTNIGWKVFILAGIATIVIALLTVSFQAVKSAIANPVKSLRSE